VLFDTGGDGPTLTRSLAALDIDPDRFDVLALSHDHADQSAGLQSHLEANDQLTIFVPSSFADGRARVMAVRQPKRIAEGIWTLGEMGTAIPEQALAVRTGRGLIVLTGCAHPRPLTVIEQARTIGDVDMVIDGFHLQDAAPGTIRGIISELGGQGGCGEWLPAAAPGKQR
jgi:7,8-dihydropterin-6-yl-methyl-4-(beta-D-ribofuranosyl)aminobenzene 5'-phosphate synthase